MRKVYQIDVNGLYVTDVIILNDSDPTPSDCVEVDPPQDGSIHIFKWDGTQWVEGKSDADLLEAYKTQKLAELQAQRDSATNGTFTSSALGSPKTYAYDTLAQSRLKGQVDILLLNPNIATVQWANDEDGLVAHTRDQFIQVVNDGYNHDSTNAYHYIQLEKSIKAITLMTDLTSAKAQVDAITW